MKFLENIFEWLEDTLEVFFIFVLKVLAVLLSIGIFFGSAFIALFWLWPIIWPHIFTYPWQCQLSVSLLGTAIFCLVLFIQVNIIHGLLMKYNG